MTADLDDFLDDLFLGCVLAAFLDQAQAERRWPEREATRERAYRRYEDALAEKHGRPSPRDRQPDDTPSPKAMPAGLPLGR